MVQFVIKNILKFCRAVGYLVDSEAPKKTNIWVDKKYLVRFYEDGEKPEWVKFCETLMDNEFEVFIYLPETSSSIYITIVKNCKLQIIRYSDHLPRSDRWLKNEIDYCIGPENLGMLSQQEVIDAVKTYFG